MVNVVGVVRRLTAADAEAVFAVALACDLVELGEPDTELSDIAWGLGVDTAKWFGVDADDGGLSASGVRRGRRCLPRPLRSRPRTRMELRGLRPARALGGRP